jgi:hypothetical protein
MQFRGSYSASRGRYGVSRLLHFFAARAVRQRTAIQDALVSIPVPARYFDGVCARSRDQSSDGSVPQLLLALH